MRKKKLTDSFSIMELSVERKRPSTIGICNILGNTTFQKERQIREKGLQTIGLVFRIVILRSQGRKGLHTNI